MTAIFMVWNTTGFAIAADDAVSVQSHDENGFEKTLWTDTGEKIFIPEGHKLAIGIAADRKINNILVNHILSSWHSRLDGQMINLNDYVVDFLNYLSTCDFPLNYEYQNSLKTRCEFILNTFEEFYREDPSNISDRISDSINGWQDAEPKNIYESDFENEYLNPYIEEDQYDDLYLNFCQDWVRNRISEPANPNLEEVVKSQIIQTFEEVFEIEFNLSEKWHSSLLEALIPYLINYIDSEAYTKLLFVGYGKDDWIPQLVKISIHPNLNRAPRAQVLQVANPLKVWFSDLAQTDQVDMFLQGYNNEYHDLAVTFVPEDSKLVASECLDAFKEKRFSEMKKKVNNLSLTKLEFVARSFVEMESLGSFLVEYLPSVGGDIKVVSMTR
jgi:hypothetical protein